MPFYKLTCKNDGLPRAVDMQFGRGDSWQNAAAVLTLSCVKGRLIDSIIVLTTRQEEGSRATNLFSR